LLGLPCLRAIRKREHINSKPQPLTDDEYKRLALQDPELR